MDFSAGQIDPEGNVELVFAHASDYTIVVDAKIMSDNGQTDNKSDETIPAPKTDDSISLRINLSCADKFQFSGLFIVVEQVRIQSCIL